MNARVYFDLDKEGLVGADFHVPNDTRDYLRLVCPESYTKILAKVEAGLPFVEFSTPALTIPKASEPFVLRVTIIEDVRDAELLSLMKAGEHRKDERTWATVKPDSYGKVTTVFVDAPNVDEALKLYREILRGRKPEFLYRPKSTWERFTEFLSSFVRFVN